jgi:hypothetical protein
MSAIQSKVKDVLCAQNAKAQRRYLNAFASEILQGPDNLNDAMYQLYQGMILTDQVVVWCWESYLDARESDLFSGNTNNFFGENFLQNVLYNLGFQFTAILDLVFIDP